MKLLSIALALLISSGAFSSTQERTIIKNKEIVALDIGECVLMVRSAGPGKLQWAVRDYVENRVRGEGLYFLHGDDYSRKAKELYITRENHCLEDSGKTVCIGDMVLKKYFDGADEIHEVIGIQAGPSGFFSSDNHLLIDAGNFVYKLEVKKALVIE